MSEAMAYWSLGTQFLSLAEEVCKELSKAGNVHIAITDKLLANGEYEEMTKWSDFSIGIPVLFNFFHGVELLLKGFIALSKQVPPHHRLTELLENFENRYPLTKVGELIKSYTKCLNPQSPLSRFFTTNGISIDDWYHALKYPDFKGRQQFSHFELKYGGTGTLNFWQSLGRDAGNLRLESVQLAKSLGQV